MDFFENNIIHRCTVTTNIIMKGERERETERERERERWRAHMQYQEIPHADMQSPTSHK